MTGLPRTLRFADDRSVGSVMVRPASMPVGGGHQHWEAMAFEFLADARGTVDVPAGKQVMLLVARTAVGVGEALAAIEDDGIQWIEMEAGDGRPALTDDDVAAIGQLGELISLDLSDTAVTDAGLAHVAGLCELRVLDLHRTGITDAGIAHLRDLRHVEKVFAACERLTDASLEVFARWGDSLREIRLSSRHVTDAGIARLAACRRLRDIHLPPSVTAEGVAALKDLPLETIVLWGNRHVDDAALRRLGPVWAAMETLDLVDLNATAVTDAGLPHLYPLKQLRWLHCEHQTGVSKSALAALAEALPGCLFDH